MIEENILNNDINQINKELINNNLEEIPLKKKRGRKPKIITEEPVIKEKKKRGRKPKITTEESVVKVYKKRGRKPTGKIIDCTKVSLSSVDDDDDCIIAHIPIQLSNIDKYIKRETVTSNDNLKSLPYLETEYIENINNNILDVDTTELESEKESLKNSLFSDMRTAKLDSYNSDPEYFKILESKIQEMKLIIISLKNELKEKNESNFLNINIHKIDMNIVDINGNDIILKDNTDISCWWCSHEFNTRPIFLPDNYYNNIYYALGCFCSFNCAMAYNVDINDYKIWIRSSYLHKLYREMTNNLNEISPSLPRQALKKYGGWLTIEEFKKKLLNINKEYRHIIPPMVPIVSIIEECSKSRNRNKNYKIELNNQKVLKANENLKLRRNKPLPSSKNSLEKTMGLKRINNII